MQASIASAVECLAELDVNVKEWKANWTRNRNIFFWRVGKTDIQEAAIFFIVALGCLLLHLSSWPADKIGCRVRTSHSSRKNYANDASVLLLTWVAMSKEKSLNQQVLWKKLNRIKTKEQHEILKKSTQPWRVKAVVFAFHLIFCS